MVLVFIVVLGYESGLLGNERGIVRGREVGLI